MISFDIIFIPWIIFGQTYYFILFLHPGICMAAIFHKSIDHSNVRALCQGQATRRVDKMQDAETPKKATEITRRSRISFEADLRLI